jgi:SAM-dependent methyltransferase
LGVGTSGIACCFDQESQRVLRDYRDKGLSDTSRKILDSLPKREIAGSTVLEVGCGVGALIIELVRKGASSAIGVDLSPKMVRLGQSLAAEAGLSESVSFALGDGAMAELKESDIVILDAVLCCYPDLASLVGNSSSAVRRLYAISVPDDTRPVARVLGLLLPLQRLIRRRSGFMFFIHSTGRVREMLEARGFKMLSKSPVGWMWTVMVFALPVAR